MAGAPKKPPGTDQQELTKLREQLVHMTRPTGLLHMSKHQKGLLQKLLTALCYTHKAVHIESHQLKEGVPMSTNDVPGANPANADKLAMGCWAEAQDGSLIFVKSVENGEVVYSMYDVARDPIVEYADLMMEDQFKKQFTWDKKGGTDRWTWHDKQVFPWKRIIKRGATDGMRIASADGILTAAERVARSLRLQGAAIDENRIAHKADDTRPGNSAMEIITRKFREALDELGGTPRR